MTPTAQTCEIRFGTLAGNAVALAKLVVALARFACFLFGGLDAFGDSIDFVFDAARLSFAMVGKKHVRHEVRELGATLRGIVSDDDLHRLRTPVEGVLDTPDKREEVRVDITLLTNASKDFFLRYLFEVVGT